MYTRVEQGCTIRGAILLAFLSVPSHAVVPSPVDALVVAKELYGLYRTREEIVAGKKRAKNASRNMVQRVQGFWRSRGVPEDDFESIRIQCRTDGVESGEVETETGEMRLPSLANKGDDKCAKVLALSLHELGHWKNRDDLWRPYITPLVVVGMYGLMRYVFPAVEPFFCLLSIDIIEACAFTAGSFFQEYRADDHLCRYGKDKDLKSMICFLKEEDAVSEAKLPDSGNTVEWLPYLFGRPGDWLRSTHPPGEKRIARIEEELKKRQGKRRVERKRSCRK